RVAHEDRVRVRRESVVEIVERADVEPVVKTLVRLDLETVGEDLRPATRAVRGDLRLVAEERAEVPKVPLSDRPEAREQEPLHATDRAEKDRTNSRFRRACSWWSSPGVVSRINGPEYPDAASAGKNASKGASPSPSGTFGPPRGLSFTCTPWTSAPSVS